MDNRVRIGLTDQTQVLFIRLLTCGWQIRAGWCLVRPNIFSAVPSSGFFRCLFLAGSRKTQPTAALCNARCDSDRIRAILLPWLVRRASTRLGLWALRPTSHREQARRRLRRRSNAREALFP